MGNRLKITSVIIFLIGAHLAILKIAEATKIVSNSTGKSDSTGEDLTSIKNDSQALKDKRSNVDLDNDDELRNYGGPDSFYGSGTR